MGSDTDLKSVQDNLSACLVDTTRAAGQLAAEDLSFLRSTDPSVAKRVDKQNARLLKLMRHLTRKAVSGTEVQAPEIGDADSVDDNWSGLVDIFDSLLEKADASLDEHTGAIKKHNPFQEASGSSEAGRKGFGRADHSQHIPKPQRSFQDVLQNDETTPFKPLLLSKPHAIVPLEESIRSMASDTESKEYDTQFCLSIIDCPLQMT